MKRFLPTVGAVVLFACLAVVGFVLRNNDVNNAASRHNLCVQIEEIRASERTLWLRVIARSPDAKPDQVAEFKRDLFELFPHHHC